MSGVVKYLRNVQKKGWDNPLGEFTHGGINVEVKNPVPSNVNLRECLSTVFDRMPKYLYKNVSHIKIGYFPFLIQRQINAMYKDGTIYLSNEHSDNYDLISDIIHEIAHAFEELNSKYLYEDKIIENEFLSKRQALYELLRARNLISYPVTEQDFYNLNYDMKFDNYLYHIIGYEKLSNISVNIFVSPYGATSLREYFANSFENFFINDMFLVRKISPNVYAKLITFLEF